MKCIRVVAALLTDPQDATRVLVQQRLPGGRRGGLWEFPGGKVEPGETDAAALERECAEELGVGLEVGRRVWGTVHAYDDLTVELELFTARIVEGTPKPLGAQALRFCTVAELRGLELCEADWPLVDELERGLLPREGHR